MQIQRFSVANYTIVAPPNFSSSPHISTAIPHNPSILALNRTCNAGFCNSLRRVTKLQTSSRRYGSLIMASSGEVKDDRFYMRRCVELARKAVGYTSPNPMVGCVIVKDGKIVGEGFHPKAGQPHAEVFALRDAGSLAEGATAYVSLEPCNHFGRTPPCTEALIKTKVKKVVAGMVDPNPIVASKGVNRLRDAGIEVIVSVEEELCKRLNEAYIHQILTGKPFVTLRYSLSVNGCFLDQLGEGVSESGGYYSKLLQENDAIIISGSLKDNLSMFTSQELGANQPMKILVARNPEWSGIQIPDLTKEMASKVVLFTNKGTTLGKEMAQKEIEKVVSDQITLSAILESVRNRGLRSVLLDLRGSFSNLQELLREGIEQNLLQKIVVEVLPWWGGDYDGNLQMTLKELRKRLKLKNLQSKISHQSVVIEGYVQ